MHEMNFNAHRLTQRMEEGPINLKNMHDLSLTLTGLASRLAIQVQDLPKVVLLDEQDRIQQLANLKQNTCYVFLIANAIVLVMVVTLDLHPELQLLSTNAIGLIFLATFSVVLVIQFVAMLFHRLRTLLTNIAFIPMTVSCECVEDLEAQRKKQPQPTTLAVPSLMISALAIPEKKLTRKVTRKLLNDGTNLARARHFS